MAAVFASAEQVERRDPKIMIAVSIAAYNGSHIVISGPVADVDEAVAELRGTQVPLQDAQYIARVSFLSDGPCTGGI